jgi:hypothetical protein
MMIVAMFAVFGGMAAMAVDLGSLMADRRDLQNSADAIALAASLDLPDQAAASAAADEWAVKNGIDTSSMTVTMFAQSLPEEPNPRVRVELEREHGFTFARLIGITSATVSTAASAIKTSAAGGANAIPLGVTQDALDGIALGESVVLKYDADNIAQGNTGPIRIDGSGSGNCNQFGSGYCSGVRVGSENVVCVEGADDTFCDGPTVVDTQPGNIIGDTRTAIQYRLDNTDDECELFGDVFVDDPDSDEDGVYRIEQDCNPFLAGGHESLRVLIVPVIDELCNGSCEVAITSFALFFLEGFGDGGCTGNDCEIMGSFVRVNQNIGLLAGTFDPDGVNQFVRLVE